MTQEPVRIVLNEWAGYPLEREKQLGSNTVLCGLGRLLNNLEKYDAKLDFTVILVINRVYGRARRWIDKAREVIPTLSLVLEACGVAKVDHAHQQRMAVYQTLMSRYPFVSEIIYRRNVGRDIGAYDCGYQYLKKRDYDGDVVFMNSSLTGPDRDGWLVDYASLYHSDASVGLVGISMNSHDTNRGSPRLDPHVQSFFLYSSMDKLKDVFPDRLPGMRNRHERQDPITNGEIAISREMLRSGYGIACRVFGGDVFFAGNPWKWDEGDLRYSGKLARDANSI